MANGIGGIPHNLAPNISKLLDQIKEKYEVGSRQRGDPMKSWVTLEELVALDLARVVRIAPGGGIVVQPPGPPNLAVPPAPTGFVVTNGFSHVFTEWASPYDAYANHARTRIYRASSDNLADAVEVGQSTGFAFADLSVATGTVYYYWIRWESTSGVLGPVNDTAGTPGQRSDDPAEILALLVGEITETHLYDALNDRIDLIDAPDTGLIDRLEAETTERLAAILALLDQLEDAEGRILASETDITALEVDVVDLETGVAAQGSALSLLTTRVTTTEGSITSQGTALTVLEAALEDAEGEIAGNASAVSALDARVTITEGSISSQSSSIVALGNSIDDLEGDVSGNTSAISSLLTGLTAAEGTISAHSSQLTSLSADVEDAVTAAEAASSAATALDARVDITESTISSHSTQLTSLSADVTDAVNAAAANASAITSLDSRVDSAEGSITSISSSITFLTSSVEDVETGLSATGTAVTALESRVEQTEDDIEAQATATTQVNARLDNFGGSGVTVEQKLFASASDVEGLLGAYTLKIDANGHVAGFGLSIETNNAGQATSYFMVNADRFAIVSSTLAKRVTGQSVTSGVLTVTTDGAHGLAAENEVMFTGMEEEEWKSETLEIIDAPTSSTFRVAVPSGYTTPMTAAIKGNFRPLSSLTRSGTVATAVFPSGHNIVVGGSIDITNADQPEWNSKFVATGVAGNNVTFTVTTGFTTPATASVKVARVTIPFVVADNRVVMDGAYIKNATINTAQVGTISVEKITGINATFIQANINEIDAFEIDVVNLYADFIHGDVDKLFSAEITAPINLIDSGSLAIYRQAGTITAPTETLTRPRYPLIFAQQVMTGGSPTDFVDIGLFEFQSATQDYSFTYSNTQFQDIASLIYLQATWFSGDGGTGQNTTAPPSTWDEMTVGRLVSFAIGSGTLYGYISSINNNSFPGSGATTGFSKYVYFEWVYVTGNTIVDPTGAISIYSAGNHPVARAYSRSRPYQYRSNEYFFRDAPQSEPKDYNIGVATDAPGITSESIRFDILMVR